MLRLKNQLIDKIMFITANFVNLAIAILFIFRLYGYSRAEHLIGILVISMIIPITLGVVNNIQRKRGLWNIVLPMFLIIFLIVELLLDYILKVNFRNTMLLWPYILIYYIGLNGMIGYNFITKKKYGFITLITYFFNLLVTMLFHIT